MYKSEAASRPALTAVEVSAMTRAREVMDNARTLASRVEALASQLLGPVPGCAQAGGLDDVTLGLFNDLKSDAERTQRWLNDANDALSRIEGAL